MTATFSFETFRAASCVVLGGMIGLLIGAPIALARDVQSGTIIVLACLGLGVLTGYRRRHSTAFFYFALFCVCILGSIVSISSLKN